MNLTVLNRRNSPRYDYDVAFDRARDEVVDALLEGRAISCGRATADLTDCAEVIACRKDFDGQIAALLTGLLSPEGFKAWALNALYDYADNMAVDRADAALSDAIDEAEYNAVDDWVPF